MTVTAKEIDTSVCQWLTERGVTWQIALIGDSCPPFCDDKGKPGIGQFPRKTHIHGQHYRLTLDRSDFNGHITRNAESVSVDFWNSYNDAERSVKVTVADVLSCVQWESTDTFEDFCSEFGYDADSRRAETTWNAVNEQARDMGRMFPQDEREELQEMLRDF